MVVVQNKNFPMPKYQNEQIEDVCHSKEKIYELLKQYRTIKEKDCRPICAGILTVCETWLYDELCKVLDKEREQLVNMARVKAIP